MIELRNVQKRFGQNQILHSVSFCLTDGTNLCLVGPSGSGKSLTARIILGLEKADEGSILFDAKPVEPTVPHSFHQFYDQFGVVFQGNALFDSLSIRENIGLKLDENGTPPEEVDVRVAEVLQEVGLKSDVLQKLPGELSGGMQKRVGIARAVIHRPKYLVYDEPTSGLDSINASKIDELIISLSGDQTRSSLIITHDLQLVKRVADQVVFLFQGRVHFAGTPDDFFRHPDSLIQDFLRRDLG